MRASSSISSKRNSSYSRQFFLLPRWQDRSGAKHAIFNAALRRRATRTRHEPVNRRIILP